MKRTITQLCVLLLLLGSVGCEKSQFEQEHNRAEARNPRWLNIKLDTSDHRRKYHENEPITFITTYSSAVPYQYKVQSSNDNEASFDVLHISPGETTSLLGAIVCCFSQLVGLTEEPLRIGLPRPLKLKPGEYDLWVSTRRIYPWSVEKETYKPSENVCASNLLRVQVVSDRR